MIAEASSINRDDLIYIGRITRTQGHRGAVRLVPEFEPITRFDQLRSNELLVQKPTQAQGRAPLLLVHWRTFKYHQQCVILEFEEIPDMTAAEMLRGSEVFVSPETIWELASEEYFAHDLVGAQVYDKEKGDRIGEVLDVQFGAAHEYLVVKAGAKSFNIPMLKAFVTKIDLSAKRIEVTLPPGFEDL